MNARLETLLANSFSGFGSKSSLANGFRLQAKGQQTVAVYFSENEPGNLVEIGLNTLALAPLLRCEEQALRRWVAEQAARTGRVRTQRGLRGRYPGVALGNEQEIASFLEALAMLRNAEAADDAMDAAVRMRLEKLALDAGFDLLSVQKGAWLVLGSTSFPQSVGITLNASGDYRIGVSDEVIGRRIAHELRLMLISAAPLWATGIEGVAGDSSLRQALVRLAAVCRVVSGEGLQSFAEQTRELPAATEVMRVVAQRVGQSVFRDSLLVYWGGRCAVTGLSEVGLLRASHIKPWAECASDAERLDVFNGLLLAPHLDALFDGGWVTFLDSGRIQISNMLDAENRASLNVSGEEVIAGLAAQHCAYLTWHREHHFRRAPEPTDRTVLHRSK